MHSYFFWQARYRIALVLLACAAQAAQVARAATPWPQKAPALGPHVLETIRGGFTTTSGLTLAIGIEHQVSINGTLVAHSSVQLVDLGGLRHQSSPQTVQALRSIKLIQNGSDNIYLGDLSQHTLGGLMIQNSLNDQHIDSRTVINASVNSAGMLTMLNFQGSLGDAITQAALPN